MTCFSRSAWVVVVSFLVLPGVPQAEDQVRVGETTEFILLVEGKPYLHVIHDGRSVKVQRVQDPDYELKGYFAKTGRKCPPFCIQPETPDPSVKPIGEVEMFDFMETKLRDGSGLLIDARTESWFRKGTIPGSVNYPFTLFGAGSDDPELVAILKSFGGKERGEIGAVERLMEDWGWVDARYKTEHWDFTCGEGSGGLVQRPCLWSVTACNPRLARRRVSRGQDQKYYRGGMQMWQLWGLTTVVPRN